MSYLKNRIKAFQYAFTGLKQAFVQEAHLKLHVIIAMLVVGIGFFFDVSKEEWIFLSLAITLVICFEMFNSALEKFCDLVMPEENFKIKYIKDVAAGAVLVACVFAIIVGLIVFLPHFSI